MKKLLLLTIIFASCKVEEHQWRVKYKTPYSNVWPPSDSAIYFIGNCCPFIDVWDAYDTGDEVIIDSIFRSVYS